MRRNRTADPTAEPPRLPRAAAHRLSLYLRCLAAWAPHKDKASSGEIAQSVGVNDAQVRRDLAALGHLGQRGVGYEVRELADAIRRTLGIDRTWNAVLVGVGNLARALLKYRGFRTQGFQVVGLFDNDDGKVGDVVEGLTIEPMDRLAERVAAEGAELGILTVPADRAQPVADALVAAGVRGILNFAPVLIRPSKPGVEVVPVDLAIQLEQLAFLVQLADARGEGPKGR